MEQTWEVSTLAFIFIGLLLFVAVFLAAVYRNEY